MKKTTLTAFIAALGIVVSVLSFQHKAEAQFSAEVWHEQLGSYVETVWPAGRDVLINGTNKYLNFNSTTGASGYGFRDNSGAIEFKDSGGSWTDFDDMAGNPGGSDTQLQFNESGTFEGTAGLTWASSTQELTMTGTSTFATTTFTGRANIDTLEINSDSFNDLTGTGLAISGNSLTADEANIDHDSLQNFVANEHIDHSGVTLTAGTNLNGGGDITANRTFNLDSTITLTGASTSEATSTISHIEDSLSFDGVIGTTWSDFCTAITGGGGLCDGSDDGASGSSGLSTTTPWNDGDIATVVDNSTVKSTATSSITDGTGLTFSGTFGNLVGGTDGTLNLDANIADLNDVSSLTNNTVLTREGGNVVSSSTVSSNLLDSVVMLEGENNSLLNNDSGYITDANDSVEGSELDNLFSQNGFLERTGANTYQATSTIDIVADTNFTDGDALTLSGSTLNFDGGASPAGELGGTWASPTLDDGALDDQYLVNDANDSTTGVINAGGFVATASSTLQTFHTDSLEINGDTFTDLTGTGLQITTNSLNVDEANVDHDSLQNFVANEHVDHSSVTFSTNNGLTGGGDLTSNRTFGVDINNQTSVTAAGSDEVLVEDASDTFNTKKVTAQSIADLASASPGGADTQIQYNNGGSFGGAGTFTFSDGGDIVTIGTSTAPSNLSTNKTALSVLNVVATSTDSDNFIEFIDETNSAVASVGSSGGFSAKDGSTVSPAYSFTNEILGMYRPSTGVIGFTEQSSELFRISSSGISLDTGTTFIGQSELNLLDGMTSKTGSDTNFVTGTAGTDQNLIEWDTNGDAIDSGIAASNVTQLGSTISEDEFAAVDFGDFTCDGTDQGCSFDTDTVNTNEIDLSISPSWTGAHDFGGATSLEIPNGTNPTVDADGEIAHDTTDNQLIVDDVPIRTTEDIYQFSVASSSDRFASGKTLTIPPEKDGYTVTHIECYVDGGTSKVVTFTDGTNDMDSITCATSVTDDDGTIANDTVTASEKMQIDMGATTGSVDFVNVSIFGRYTRE